MLETGEFRTICHAGVELRFYQPIEWEVHAGWREGLYTCVLRDSALATRLRDRINHGRAPTPAGAVKNLTHKLLRLVQSPDCPSVLASLVEHIGPREHDSRAPVTEMLRQALLAQWLCIEERRGRVFCEVTIRQDPSEPPLSIAPSYRLDLVLLEPPHAESPLRITAVEIKSSRADFSTDRKWHGYIGRADRLYIATLPGVVRKGELPEGVGLLELRLEPDGSGLFERSIAAGDAFVMPDARADLLYGLALCDRRTDSGWNFLQQTLHSVEEYWASRNRRRRPKTAASVTAELA